MSEENSRVPENFGFYLTTFKKTSEADKFFALNQKIYRISGSKTILVPDDVFCAEMCKICSSKVKKYPENEPKVCETCWNEIKKGCRMCFGPVKYPESNLEYCEKCEKKINRTCFKSKGSCGKTARYPEDEPVFCKLHKDTKVKNKVERF